MMVFGTDPHKRSHTVAALDGLKAERVDELSVRARDAGHERLLAWARELDGERVWALEDCRHVSGGLERFLLRSGERVVRVSPKLMAGARRSAREFGKSDAIDAAAVAQAAIREGVETLPEARCPGRSARSRFCSTTARTWSQSALESRTDCAGFSRPRPDDRDPGAGARPRQVAAAASGPSRPPREQTVQVRIMREQLRRCRELTRQAKALERELGALVRRQAPQLLALPGCGPDTPGRKRQRRAPGARRNQLGAPVGRRLHPGVPWQGGLRSLANRR